MINNVDRMINELFAYSDEDMQSMASLMSHNNNSDIAPLEDFDDEDDTEGWFRLNTFHRNTANRKFEPTYI